MPNSAKKDFFRHEIPGVVFDCFASPGRIEEIGSALVVNVSGVTLEAKVRIAPFKAVGAMKSGLGWLRHVSAASPTGQMVERVEIHMSRANACEPVSEGFHPETVTYIDCKPHDSGDPKQEVIVRGEIQWSLVRNGKAKAEPNVTTAIELLCSQAERLWQSIVATPQAEPAEDDVNSS